jgi:hypothetical protein
MKYFEFIAGKDPSILELKIKDTFVATKKNALDISIEKWETLVRIHELGILSVNSGGMDTCGLCIVYADTYDNEGVECSGCPVRVKTGKPFCLNTPHQQFEKAHEAKNLKGVLSSAKNELKFLKELKKS